MNSKKLLLITTFIMSLVSCRPKEIEVQVPPAESKIVVFSQALINNGILVSLTKSASVLSDESSKPEELLISGAKVEISHKDNTYLLDEVKSGVYSNEDIILEPGTAYRLTAEYLTETIYAESIMPEPVEFQKIEPKKEATELGEENFSLALSFQDDPAIANWYLINIYETPDINQDNYNDYLNNPTKPDVIQTLLISDLEFDKTFERQIFLPDVTKNDKISVTLSNISKEYFDLLSLRIETDKNIFSLISLEPTTYPTNIQNGYGIFNTHQTTIKFFDLSKY